MKNVIAIAAFLCIVSAAGCPAYADATAPAKVGMLRKAAYQTFKWTVVKPADVLLTGSALGIVAVATVINSIDRKLSYQEGPQLNDLLKLPVMPKIGDTK